MTRSRSSPVRPMGGRLFLFDAHGYLHRAYHALPPLTNSRGEPVGALFGFARMLLGVLKREKPEFAVVCFDAPGPTFRHKAYAEYKATRKETDLDLRSQLVQARPLAQALGLQCVELAGYEADDLMATLAERAGKAGLEAVLVTSDKDAMQLVDDRVKVLHESKGLMDAAKVVERFGVEPRQMADYLALVGDSSDNVPGVPGIGPVGAAKLLARYGSLERLLEAARGKDGALPAKAAQALAGSAEQARKSRELVVLDTKAPVAVELEECRVVPVDPERAAPVLKKLELNAILKDLAASPLGTPAPESPGRASSPAPAMEEPPIGAALWFKAAAKARRAAAAFARGERTELLGEGPWTLALALPDGRACRVEAGELERHGDSLGKLFSGKTGMIGHDLKPALAALRRAGVSPRGPEFDTMVAAWCLNPSERYDFATVLAKYGGLSLPEEAGGDPGQAAVRQARLCFGLADRLERELSVKGLAKLYGDMELPLIEALAAMETEGIGVDRRALETLRVEFEEGIAGLSREINRLAGVEVNVNSPKQLAKLLFEDLKLPVVFKTPKGDPSTGEETLKALMDKHPLPAKILDFRELSKLKSTYVDGLLERLDPATGRVHTHFNQAGTATGRLSSLDPNLQNIPIRTPMGQKIRRAFVARKGCVLLSADYSQIDLRVLAHLSGDPALLEAFESGQDVHLRTACEIFKAKPADVDKEMRRRAKAVNFGIVYGQTAHGLALELGITRPQAQDYIDRYFQRYAGVKVWLGSTLEAAKREGRVKTMLGRVRWLPDLQAKNTALRQFNERVAVNTPIQGTSADIIKVAMVNIHRALRDHPGKWKSRPVLQVHDELLFECPAAEARSFGKWARGEMESAVELKVPTVVDVKAGPNWQDMEKAA